MSTLTDQSSTHISSLPPAAPTSEIEYHHVEIATEPLTQTSDQTFAQATTTIVQDVGEDNVDDCMSPEDIERLFKEFTIYDAPPPKTTPSAADMYMSAMKSPAPASTQNKRIQYWDPIDEHNAQQHNADEVRSRNMYDYDAAYDSQLGDITFAVSGIKRAINEIAGDGANISESITALNILLDEHIRTQTIKNNLLELRLTRMETQLESMNTSLNSIAEVVRSSLPLIARLDDLCCKSESSLPSKAD
jgi:hypothetical protein